MKIFSIFFFCLFIGCVKTAGNKLFLPRRVASAQIKVGDFLQMQFGIYGTDEKTSKPFFLGLFTQSRRIKGDFVYTAAGRCCRCRRHLCRRHSCARTGHAESGIGEHEYIINVVRQIKYTRTRKPVARPLCHDLFYFILFFPIFFLQIKRFSRRRRTRVFVRVSYSNNYTGQGGVKSLSIYVWCIHIYIYLQRPRGMSVNGFLFFINS